MKKLLLLIINLLLPFYFVAAQSDTVFLNEKGIITSKESAVTFRVYEPLEEKKFRFYDYDFQQRLRKTYHANNKSANMLHGEYKEFDDKGYLSITGNYVKGYRSGEWREYFLYSDKLKEVKVYEAGSNVYYVVQYDSVNNRKEAEGRIDQYGKRDGIWKNYHTVTDTLKILTNFVTGKREGIQLEYYKNGTLKRKELFENNKLKKGEQWDTSGKKIKYFPALVYPQYKEYISNYLHREAPCTAEVLKKANFNLRILISKEGKVLNVEVINVDDKDCAIKIKQALLQMKVWKPALWENMPIKFTYETTVKLYLPRE